MKIISGFLLLGLLLGPAHGAPSSGDTRYSGVVNIYCRGEWVSSNVLMLPIELSMQDPTAIEFNGVTCRPIGSNLLELSGSFAYTAGKIGTADDSYKVIFHKYFDTTGTGWYLWERMSE